MPLVLFSLLCFRRLKFVYLRLSMNLNCCFTFCISPLFFSSSSTTIYLNDDMYIFVSFPIVGYILVRKVWRYQRGNQKPYTEEWHLYLLLGIWWIDGCHNPKYHGINLFHDISPSCLVNEHCTSYVLLLCISSVKIHISNM